MRVIGCLLMLIGLAILVISPIAYSYLDQLGCAMNTTGCKNYRFDWTGAAIWLTIPLLLGSAMTWGGYRMTQTKHGQTRVEA